MFDNEPLSGIVSWLGFSETNQLKVSIKFDEPVYGLGGHNSRNLTVPALELVKANDFYGIEDFGCIESPIIPGFIAPVSRVDITSICGKNRGIQGQHNSCYLDATLFGMFNFTSAFESFLYRPASCTDISNYELIQRMLREEIVNPLRTNFYVRADRVMKLRTLMKEELKDTSFTTEEKEGQFKHFFYPNENGTEGRAQSVSLILTNFWEAILI